MRLFVLSLVLSVCAYPSLASAKAISLDETSPKQLLERVEKLQEQAENLDKRKQKAFLRDAEALSLKLSNVADFSDLNAAEKVLIVNAYESLRERGDGDAGSERVCERVKRIGSNMPTTVCMTRDQRDYEQELAREKMRASSGTGRSGD
jgi:hypothetical protein